MRRTSNPEMSQAQSQTALLFAASSTSEPIPTRWAPWPVNITTHESTSASLVHRENFSPKYSKGDCPNRPNSLRSPPDIHLPPRYSRDPGATRYVRCGLSSELLSFALRSPDPCQPMRSSPCAECSAPRVR